MALSRNIFLLFSFLLLLASCSKRNYNVDAETYLQAPEREKGGLGLIKKKADPVAVADTARPALAMKADTTAQEPLKGKKRKIKKNKKEFLGYRIKRGFTKSGSGQNAVVEIFYYLPDFVEPNPYAPAKYYFSTRRKRL